MEYLFGVRKLMQNNDQEGPPTVDLVMGRIRAYRAENGLQVRQMAAAAGVMPSTLSAVIHGRAVTTTVLIKIESVIPASYSGYAPPATVRISRKPKNTEYGGISHGA